MKVLYVTSEALPFMASGGLGDVAGSLPQALRKRLIGCRVVMPLYEGIPEKFKAEMKFIARYVATNATVTAGTANADSQFTVEYKK